MAKLPVVVSEAWEKRAGAIVFSTVDGEGVPNAIYATCVKKLGDDRIVVADNYFNKTRANIAGGSLGSVLFITGENKAYQLKGKIEYLTSGEIFDDMQKWVEDKHPRVAAAVLVVEEVYSGGEKLA